MKNTEPSDGVRPAEKRIPVYGREPATGRKKRAFDCLLADGQPWIESVNTQGQRIRTTREAALAALAALEQADE